MILDKLRDYQFYSKNFQKIKTKLSGIQPFILREYQSRFIDFWDNIEGPKRIIVLKPRQAGFSTLIASKLSHPMCTEEYYKGIAMADKKGRTAEIASMYSTFVNELPYELKPMIHLNNSEQIFLDNPSEKFRADIPGLNSGVKFETANDPNAGRSGTRLFAHLSEVAFYRYMKEIDDGIQNSIPLSERTTIVKESTANGRAGIGKPFYDLWNAAKRGDSIYKPFFVAWYEVDDYQIKPPRDFKPTKHELELLKQCPTLTKANLVWRRLKITEYLDDDEKSILSPDERFKQDFPLTDEEAFLSTGAPVFETETVNAMVNSLNKNKISDLKDRLRINSFLLKNHWDGLRIYTPPRDNLKYYIGADVSEGLAIGDASSCFVMDQNYNQVARWHGKIDADLYGHLLIALGELYNNALICPEKNNMGISTVLTIRNEGYPNLYKYYVEDKVTKVKTEKLGWTTTKQSKMDMLNELIKFLRTKEVRIMDIRLAEEMSLVSREENGTVDLNGRDRVVACCLALVARRNEYFKNQPSKDYRSKEEYDTKTHQALRPSKKTNDIFG